VRTSHAHLADPLKNSFWSLHRRDADTEPFLSAIHFPAWQDIVIAPGFDPPHPDLTVRGGRIPGSQEPQGSADANDFSWVAEIEKAAAESGTIDDRCFNPDPPRDLVLSRLRLVTGTIGSTVALLGDRPTIWDFRSAQSGKSVGYSQALASQIEYARDITGTSVTLRFVSFKGGTPIDVLLTPAAKNEVVVKIGSLPLLDLLGQGVDDYPQQSPVDHFSLLYRLSKKQPVEPSIPVAICHPRVIPGAGSLAGTLICPGGQGSPHPQA
jgi:hypothetical protein